VKPPETWETAEEKWGDRSRSNSVTHRGVVVEKREKREWKLLGGGQPSRLRYRRKPPDPGGFKTRKKKKTMSSKKGLPLSGTEKQGKGEAVKRQTCRQRSLKKQNFKNGLPIGGQSTGAKQIRKREIHVKALNSDEKNQNTTTFSRKVRNRQPREKTGGPTTKNLAGGRGL